MLRFKPDFCLFRRPNIPMLIVEVAFTQRREDAIQKTQLRMANMERLITAITIDVIEKPPYQGPSKPSELDDYISEEDWDAMAQASPFGPIRRSVDNLSWIGSILCTIDIIITNDPEGLGVQRVVRGACDSV
jgi:hypothetical protein